MLDLGGSVGLTEPVAQATLQKESQDALPPKKKRSLLAIPLEVALGFSGSTWRSSREAFVSFQHEALHYILPSRCLTA
jgi:hypothetical protein